MGFLQKRWVRAVGFVTMILYSIIGIEMFRSLINETVFRPPELVFYPGDMIGWFGYLFFLSIIFVSGIFAFLAAHYMRGVFRLLYFTGVLAICYSLSFIWLSIKYNVDVEFNPKIENEQILVGKWINERNSLQLFEDSTYTLSFDDRFFFWGDSAHYEGKWKLERNEITMSDVDPGWKYPWEVRTSDGYYFITFQIPENPDAWTGNLGLMRELKWLDNH